MKIGIDARFYGPVGKGLGRYTQKLIENLEKVDKTNQYFIFLRKSNFGDYVPKNPNFEKVLADYRWYTFSEQFLFLKKIRSFNLDLMHFPHFNVPLFYTGKFIVTIHDLILVHFPTIRNSTLHPIIYKLKFWAYQAVIKNAIYRSNRIIAVSEFTKKDILTRYRKIPPEKIQVTYEACEDYCMLCPNKDEEILSRYGIMKPYLLYVGNAYPHKNLERLVSAFSDLLGIKKDIRLVLVGGMDYFYSRLKDFTGQRNVGNVIFPGYVPDHDLDVLFHNAAAYVFPSLYEGFGLPPLEAMAKGAPVISSDHPCMKEILEGSALYFNGRDLRSITSCMEKILDDEELRNNLIEKGYAQTKKYSWKKMSQATLGIYQSVRIK